MNHNAKPDVLGAIAEISGQIVGPFEAEELYDRVVDTVTKLSGAAAGSLWLIDRDGMVRIKAARGYHKNLLDPSAPNPRKLVVPAEYPLGEGVTGTIAQKGEVVRTKPGTRHQTEHPEWIGKYDTLQWPQGGTCVSFLGVALRLPYRIIGLLKVENKTAAEEFSKEDEDMMLTLASACYRRDRGECAYLSRPRHQRAPDISAAPAGFGASCQGPAWNLPS